MARDIIFEPLETRGLTYRNRLVRSATWEGLAAPDGGIGEDTVEIYRELAAGGIGAIIGGFTSVSDEDCYIDGQMRLSRDELVPAYASLVDAVHDEGCPIIAQLALGAFYRRDFLGRLIQVEPDQMTVDDIALVRRQFVDAARRAAAAGFDGVQVHVAHFFFLSRFVSPAVNHRADEYGGTPENRARLVCEIVREIREEVPTLHVSAKVNCSDFTRGGLDETQALELCRLLAGAGIDSIEVSGNGTSVAGIKAHVNEAYFEPFALRLAAEVDVPVILVGGMRSRAAINDALSAGIAAVSLSRPLLFDPEFPNKLQTGEVEHSRCVSCNRCYSTPGHRCVFAGRL